VKNNPIKTMEIEQPAGLGGARPQPQFVSDAIADVLGALGYEYVTLNPGSSFRGLHDSLVNYHRNRTPKVMLCSHEEIAVAFAHGYAKAAQRPGLAICHNLVGLMHGSMAIYDAWCDRTPMLILGGAGPADPNWRRWIDFTHSANTQGELVRAFVKWEDEPATPAAAISSIIRGHRIATTPPCGPVYIALDKILQETALAAPLQIPDLSLPRYAAPALIYADPRAVGQAAEALLGAKMPVVAAGSLSYDPRATRELVALVEAIGGAYVDTLNHVSFPSVHPQNLNGDGRVMKEADVVLAIDVLDVPDLVGMYGDEEGRRPASLPAVTVIDLSLNDFAFRSWSHVGGDLSPADIRLLADPIAGMSQLIEAVKARAQDGKIGAQIKSRIGEISARHRSLRAHQAEEAAVRAKEPGVSRSRLVDMTWEAVRGRDCVLSGRSLKGWPEGVWDFKGVGEFLGANVGGGIGYGPGAAVGAAIATHEQGKFPIVILGDGDMVMAAGALWTAVHYRIPMLAIIDNNRSFMNDEEHQRKMARHRERPLENAWIGTAMFDPEVDFATVSRGFGAWAKGPIESAQDLAPALKEAIAEVDKGGVAVIDVRTVRPW